MTATDYVTGDLLDLIAADPIHRNDREAVEAAIKADAALHDSNVNPNRVRALLAVDAPWVQPQVIGATYYAMKAQGRLIPTGWTTSEDREGRNSGKPARTYRLVTP